MPSVLSVSGLYYPPDQGFDNGELGLRKIAKSPGQIIDNGSSTQRSQNRRLTGCSRRFLPLFGAAAIAISTMHRDLIMSDL